MTGYESKKAAANAKLEQAKEILLQSPQKDIDWQREQQIKAHAKLDEEGMYLVHQTAQPAQEPWCMKMNGCNTKCEDCPDEAALAQPVQEPWRESASDYERGVIDGRQKQAQSSVDKAVNRMAQRPWVGLSEGEVDDLSREMVKGNKSVNWLSYSIEAKLKEKNNAA